MLSLSLPEYEVHDTAVIGNTLFATIIASRTAARCPDCGCPSSRVHSRYVRQIKDLPAQGRSVELRVIVRRFRCAVGHCPRKTFAEPLDQLAERHAQRTTRLTDVLQALILRVSSHTGAYLAERLGIPTSPRTLLRLVTRHQPEAGALRVVGIDDFALRRGQTYATLICDLESGRPVDIISGRNAETVREWLQAHPGIQVVVRDRATSYADAANAAVPDAVQVADRFHLVRNVMDALKEVVDSKSWTLPLPPAAESHPVAEPPTAGAPEPPPKPNRQQAKKEATARRRRERYEEIQRRYHQGESLRSIARAMGLSRHTVKRYVKATRVPLYAARRPRSRKIDRFVDYMRQRWDDGCHNARQLYDELVSRGYAGAASTVRHLVSAWRKQSGTKQGCAPVPRWRDLRWLILFPPERLSTEQQERLTALLDLNPPLKLAHHLTQWFRRMLRERRADEFDRWLQAAAGSALPPFRRLARTMSEDRAALLAGIRLPWSTGPVEGHIHRVKLLKRLGYGRASLALLRARVLSG